MCVFPYLLLADHFIDPLYLPLAVLRSAPLTCRERPKPASSRYLRPSSTLRPLASSVSEVLRLHQEDINWKRFFLFLSSGTQFYALLGVEITRFFFSTLYHTAFNAKKVHGKTTILCSLKKLRKKVNYYLNHTKQKFSVYTNQLCFSLHHVK